jgi:hypothetical protein
MQLQSVFNTAVVFVTELHNTEFFFTLFSPYFDKKYASWKPIHL